MPVEHVVLLDVADETAPYMREALGRGLASLAGIEGVLGVKYGETFTTERAKGFTHAIVVTLASKEALEKYAVDPLHKRRKGEHCTRFIENLCERPVLAVDIDRDARNGSVSQSDAPFWKFAACHGRRRALILERALRKIIKKS